MKDFRQAEQECCDSCDLQVWVRHWLESHMRDQHVQIKLHEMCSGLECGKCEEVRGFTGVCCLEVIGQVHKVDSERGGAIKEGAKSEVFKELLEEEDHIVQCHGGVERGNDKAEAEYYKGYGLFFPVLGSIQSDREGEVWESQRSLAGGCLARKGFKHRRIES